MPCLLDEHNLPPACCMARYLTSYLPGEYSSQRSIRKCSAAVTLQMDVTVTTPLEKMSSRSQNTQLLLPHSFHEHGIHVLHRRSACLTSCRCPGNCLHLFMSLTKYSLRRVFLHIFLHRYYLLCLLFLCCFFVFILYLCRGILCINCNGCSNNDIPLEYFYYPLNYNFHELLEWYDTDNMEEFLNVTPINLSPYHFRLLPRISSNSHCFIPRYSDSSSSSSTSRNSTQRLLIAVKTTHSRWLQRQLIRRTWVNSQCFSRHGMEVAVVFLLGESSNNSLEEVAIRRENELHGDILQQDFIDNYYNNTLKMMMALKYAATYCLPEGMDYLLIVDDDYFVNPLALSQHIQSSITQHELSSYVGGTVIYHAPPQRQQGSKWYISREHYPYQSYPNYPSGGFILLSSTMVHQLHITSRFVKFFPFDDVFLGFLLFKLHIAPTHIPAVRTTKPKNLTNDIIASHGFKSGTDMLLQWCWLKLDEQCLITTSQWPWLHNTNVTCEESILF